MFVLHQKRIVTILGCHHKRAHIRGKKFLLWFPQHFAPKAKTFAFATTRAWFPLIDSDFQNPPRNSSQEIGVAMQGLLELFWLYVCLGSLSCWNVHLTPRFSFLAGEIYLTFNDMSIICRESMPYHDAPTTMLHCMGYGVLWVTVLSPNMG